MLYESLPFDKITILSIKINSRYMNTLSTLYIYIHFHLYLIGYLYLKIILKGRKKIVALGTIGVNRGMANLGEGEKRCCRDKHIIHFK